MELERYRYEGIALEAMLHGEGMSFTLAANNYNPDIIENLPKLVAKLVPNPHNQIPTDPGFCIDRAWFRDPLTADQGEEIMMSAQLPSHADIEFLILMSAGNKPNEQSLLERSAVVDAKLSIFDKMHVSNLRASPRPIGGLSGDELVTRFSEKNDAVVFTFWWEVNGSVDNVLIPHFSFTMETGKSRDGPVPSSLSQHAALALWDKISSSIRFHTPGPAKHTAPVPPAAKASQAPEA